MKKSMIIVSLFILWAITQTAPCNAQTKNDGEFTFSVLSDVSKIEVEFKGPDGEIVKMLEILVTKTNASGKDTVGEKLTAYIPNTPENINILTQKKAFWVDIKERTPRNGDWAEPTKDNKKEKVYNLIYSWGQIQDFEDNPTISDIKLFPYLRLDNIVEWEVAPKFKFGLFSRSIEEPMYQLLVTTFSVNNGKVKFDKEVVYIDKNDHNRSILKYSNAFFVDIFKQNMTKNGWVDSKNNSQKDVSKGMNRMFAWGSIKKLKYTPLDQKVKPDEYPTQKAYETDKPVAKEKKQTTTAIDGW